MQVLLITPQREEFNYFLKGLLKEGCVLKNVLLGSIEGAKTRDLEITVATGGHGKAQFAAQTQYLISRLPGIDLVICAGASGSLVKHLSVGDIVVATSTIEHDYKLRFVEEPLPVHSGHTESINQLQDIAEQVYFPFEIHFGRIASGDEDIINREQAKKLRARTDALCVAWEGSGGARAAALNNLPFLEVRVITDTADVSAAEDYQKSLAKAVPNIASLLVQWLQNWAKQQDVSRS